MIFLKSRFCYSLFSVSTKKKQTIIMLLIHGHLLTDSNNSEYPNDQLSGSFKFLVSKFKKYNIKLSISGKFEDDVAW